jgi:hypothetical protein
LCCSRAPPMAQTRKRLASRVLSEDPRGFCKA